MSKQDQSQYTLKLLIMCISHFSIVHQIHNKIYNDREWYLKPHKKPQKQLHSSSKKKGKEKTHEANATWHPSFAEINSVSQWWIYPL